MHVVLYRALPSIDLVGVATLVFLLWFTLFRCKASNFLSDTDMSNNLCGRYLIINTSHTNYRDLLVKVHSWRQLCIKLVQPLHFLVWHASIQARQQSCLSVVVHAQSYTCPSPNPCTPHNTFPSANSAWNSSYETASNTSTAFKSAIICFPYYNYCISVTIAVLLV